MPIFKSPAFLQQCFAVHPLSLQVKALKPGDMVGIVCANCHMRHRVVMAPSPDLSEATMACVTAHGGTLRVSHVDVERDELRIRCDPCRRTYDFGIAEVETLQK